MARICLSTGGYPPDIGGVATAAERLAGTLVAAGHTVHVVTLCDGEDAAARDGVHRALEGGVQVHRVHYRTDDRRAAFEVRALVRALDEDAPFDIFHGFFLTAVQPCISAVDASGHPRPIIASIRGNDALTLKDMPFTRASVLTALRRADWVTSVNQAYLDLVSADVDIAGRASVIRNGVKQSPEAAAPWVLGPDNRGVVGLVGNLRKVKDIPLLVRGYAAIPGHLRRRLILAGAFSERDEEEWTQCLIEEFGLASQVSLTGGFRQPEVFSYLRSMHVYVQSSAFEGLPNALLEAAAIGLPLVATAVGGMKEVLTHEQTGLLVPHGDSVALGAAITRILADDDLAQHLSRGARALAGQLSPERERAEWLALYDRLLGT